MISLLIHLVLIAYFSNASMQMSTSLDAGGKKIELENVVSFPYGISSFKKCVKNQYFYADKSSYIKDLEIVGCYCKIWRPRRFGKSFICSMFEEYYDAANSVAQVLFLFYENSEADIYVGLPDFIFIRYPFFMLDRFRRYLGRV
jgi:hypothetical protein